MNRRNVAVLAFYSLLTLVLTFPLPLTMDKALAGSSADVYFNPWADWWTEKALTGGLDFYYTDYLFYPQGTSLVYHSFSHANTAISLPLTSLVGRFVAYNITILLSYALSGFSMYLLANYLTGCPSAALIAGLVFAFCPYHMSESVHPVLVTTQWIPLFALALIRTLYGRGDANAGCATMNRRRRAASWVKQPLLAAWWFLLTALSSWHLMLILGGWAALYLLYGLFFERTDWAPGAFRSLILLTIVAGLAVAPFLWPLIREQLTENTTYMAVDVEAGLANDLLSFLVPNQWHPLFSSYFADVYERIGFTTKRPAYWGYVALGLAIGGVVTARRRPQARFWLLAGLIFFVLSLGSKVTLGGTPLHAFHLPWAVPIIGLLRHPFRLNTLLFFSLAILVGFGSHWLYEWIAVRSKPLARLALVLTACLILFEYLVFPFPSSQLLPCSSFFSQLAQEEGEFGVVDLPMGRGPSKYYMFNQMIHGKKIIEGHISRTPDAAYAFIDSNPWLRELQRTGTMPPEHTDMSRQLATLAQEDIRYIILHKTSRPPLRLNRWRHYFLIPPRFEDDLIIAYPTAPLAGRDFTLADELAPGIGPIRVIAPTECLHPGWLLEVDVGWGTTAPPGQDLDVKLALVAGGGIVRHAQTFPLSPDWPTREWPANAVAWAYYTLRIPPAFPSGAYSVTLRLVNPVTGAGQGQPALVGRVVVSETACTFPLPPGAVAVDALFGDDLRLLGYQLDRDGEQLRLTLHWRSERRMETDYKVFVHVLDPATGLRVAQDDSMPLRWTYPTTLWEAGEVVSDEIPLSLAEAPAGVYSVVVGVYDPATMERLLVVDAEGRVQPDAQVVFSEETIEVERDGP